MNMLSAATPWNKVASGYAETTMKYFQGYIDSALALANLAGGSSVLDIACGPGTLALTAARQGARVQAIDFSAAMIELLNRSIAQHAIDTIETYCGDAQHLPYADASFDAAFSMFGLMFFPNRQRGYAEAYRTLKPGGKVVLSSWAPVADSPAMQAVFGALRAINPAIPEPQTDIASLENPAFFQAELEQAGFTHVSIQRDTQAYPIRSIDQFWADMVKGNAPLVMLKEGMAAAEWEEKNRLALDYLHKTYGQKPPRLTSDAWIAIGHK